MKIHHLIISYFANDLVYYDLKLIYKEKVKVSPTYTYINTYTPCDVSCDWLFVVGCLTSSGKYIIHDLGRNDMHHILYLYDRGIGVGGQAFTSLPHFLGQNVTKKRNWQHNCKNLIFVLLTKTPQPPPNHTYTVRSNNKTSPHFPFHLYTLPRTTFWFTPTTLFESNI